MTMVDTLEDISLSALLDWLNTFPGFQSKLIFKDVPGAGRGLFIAEGGAHPGTRLLVIPAASLLNPLTLGKSSLNTIPLELFPPASSTASPPRHSPNGTPRLYTTQLLTLHLALSRDPLKRHKSEWQTFIDSLPATFRPWHPLTWLVPSPEDDPSEVEWWKRLAGCLSKSVRGKLANVKKRFDEDVVVLRSVLANEEPFKSQNLNESISDNVLLWAWLNVNTRTVSMPLGLSEPPEAGKLWPFNNHSFVPLLDMINHSSLAEVVCPKPEPMPASTLSRTSVRGGRVGSVALGVSKANVHLIPGKVDQVLFAPLRGLEEAEEVVFTYGPHSNAMLFAEYGFAEIDESGDPLGWPYGEVDIAPWVEQAWAEGDGTDEKREALEDAKLWGNFTLRTNSGDPVPSVALMSTLCVLCTPAQSKFTVDGLQARSFSYATKLSARRALATICHSVLNDLEDCRNGLEVLEKQTTEDDVDKAAGMSVVRALFREEEAVTRKVLILVQSRGSIPGF